MGSKPILPKPIRWRFVAFGMMGWVLLVVPARASDLAIQAMGTETGSWSSNPLLAVQGAKALYGSTTSPEFILKDNGPMSQFSWDSRVDENIFNQTVFNSTDAHETGNFSMQNQHWGTVLQAKADYDTTRTSELTTFGLTPVIARHLGLSVTPQITYSPSALDLLSLQGGVTSSKYDNSVFTNYETFAATPSLTHRFDPQNAAIFSLQAQRYQTTRGTPINIDTVGPSVGWQFTFSPRFTANAAVGAQTSREFINRVASQPWKVDYTFQGGLTFQGLQDTVNATTARAQYPYGDGTEALQTSFAFTESHALTPLFALNVGANYPTSSYPIESQGNLKSQGAGSLGLTYHATERVDLTGSYQYRRESLIEDTRTPHDNAFMLSLVLHPKLWTLGD